MLTGFVFILVLISVVDSEQLFRKLFADTGIEINCPSGNRVYIHPITDDLQQCSQQLGVYNETSCPGGTVCERFPILIPDFQDYCCWVDDTTEEEEITIESTTLAPEEPFPYTDETKRPKRPVVEAIIERPDKKEERKSGSVTSSEDSDESEWESETTRRTKRPRSRKVSTTSTEEPFTTTSHRPVVNRRLPKCNNPSDTVLIDFGNKLRDCHFQKCYNGYKCEYNEEIRRLICCGRDMEVFPPPGLPMLPAPKPLIPRPFLPPIRPFGLLNDNNNDHDKQQLK